MSREDEKSRRQITREQTRRAGDRSAHLANLLMKLPAPAVKKLELDEELRDTLERARAVTSRGARRRAERSLAGDLRKIDLKDLAAQLARIHESENADALEFQAAERWRARMIDEGVEVLAEFPGADAELPRLVEAARRERATGRPPGAAKALFRHVVQLLKAQRADAASDDAADGNDEDEDGDAA